MAETPTPPTETKEIPPVKQAEIKPPTKLTDKDFEQPLFHLEGVERKLDEFIGKPGHNPYLYRNAHILPLRSRYNDGERTEALKAAMMALPKDPQPLIKKRTVQTETVKQADIKQPPK